MIIIILIKFRNISNNYNLESSIEIFSIMRIILEGCKHNS